MKSHKSLFTFLTLGLSLSAVPSYAAAPNTPEQRGYAGSLYVGAEAWRQSSTVFDYALFSGQSLVGGLSFASYDIEEETGRGIEGDTDVMSGSVGYFHEFEGFNIGLMINVLDANLEVKGSNTPAVSELDNDGDGFLVTVGAGKRWDSLTVTMQASAGELSFDSERLSAFPFAKNADYDLQILGFELAAAYALIDEEAYTLTPFAKLGYVLLENDGFEEGAAGTPNDARIYADFEDEQPFVEVGVDAQLLNLAPFIPRASVSIWQDLGDDEVEYETDAVTYKTPDAVQTVVEARLGFDWAISEEILLGASVGYFAGDEIDGVNGDLALVWRF